MTKLEKILARSEKNRDIEDMDTVEKFLKLPEARRFKWGVFYREPYALEMGEWRKWRDYLKTNFPVQYFFRETIGGELRFLRVRWREFVYYWKCLFWRRYHVLKLRDDPRYNNPSAELLQAFEKILERFYQEDPYWNSDERDQAAKKVIERAYNWFKQDKKAKEKVISDLLHELYGCEEGGDILSCFNREDTPERIEKRARLSLLETLLEDEETNILIDLIKYRDYLWT